ncbi:unnamed protein product, partial [Closterium sp. NIES-53]
RPIGGSISKGGSALAWRCSCREHQLCWTCPSPSCTSPSSRCDTVQCGGAMATHHVLLPHIPPPACPRSLRCP